MTNIRFIQLGRFSLTITRDSESEYRMSFHAFPRGMSICGFLCDEFTKDWGSLAINIRFARKTVEIQYRFGKKCFLGNKLT